MDLFSCRNCTINPGQGLFLGPGQGFCLQFNSLIQSPEWTTCKYLHRKDLPHFHVDDAIKEHAAEFAGFTAMVDMRDMSPVHKIRYSEKWAWDHHAFNPVVHALSQYHKVINPYGDQDEIVEGGGLKWRFISAFSGSCDGVRSLVHASLVRRYMDTCSSWESSYRHVLALIQDVDIAPVFYDRWLLRGENGGTVLDEAKENALWEIVFSRFSAIQEYGWHSGQEELVRLTDYLNGGLSEFDWPALCSELSKKKTDWTDLVIRHADENGQFFPTGA